MLFNRRSPSSKTRGPDDGVGDTHAPQNLLGLSLAPKVREFCVSRGVGHGELDYSPDARPSNGFEQTPGTIHRPRQGGPSGPEPYPLGVVEDTRSLRRPAKLHQVGEVQTSRLHQPADCVCPFRILGQSRASDALVQQTPIDVSAGETECAVDSHCVDVGQG